jgi:hypothetical protein
MRRPKVQRSEMTPLDARIAGVIEAYDSHGWHRTATEVDRRSADWLAEQLRSAGLGANVEEYPFQRFVPGEAFIETGGARIEGLPLFDAPSTPAHGVDGVLGDSIALIDGPSGGPFEALAAARRSSASGVVYVTHGLRPGLAPRNAEAFRSPFGIPALQVSSECSPHLRHGMRARLVSYSTFEATTAANVVATARGSDPASAPVGVMTPRSGWWNCASERGGGIAAWLEVARGVAAARPRRTVEFVASTGHELGHWGLEEYFARRPGLAGSAHLWLHFGASNGAALDPRPRAFASSGELIEQVQAELERAGAAIPVFAPVGSEPAGESREIHRAGGVYVSLLGGSAVFHLEADRWPEAVDVPQVAAVARAATALVLSASS